MTGRWKRRRVECPFCHLVVEPLLYTALDLRIWICPECRESVEDALAEKSARRPERDKMVRTGRFATKSAG